MVNFVGNYTQTVKSWGRTEKIAEILKDLITGYEKKFKLRNSEHWKETLEWVKKLQTDWSDNSVVTLHDYGEAESY